MAPRDALVADAPGRGWAGSDRPDLLGGAVRSLRLAHRLTLVELAAMADLSHSFLSQVERGLARPSMSSLHRIASALQTTQAELMAGTTGDSVEGSGVVVVPANSGSRVRAPGDGYAELLVGNGSAFHPMLFTGRSHGLEEYYQHPEDEFVYVMEGGIELDIGEADNQVLMQGDSVYYRGGTPHRWASLGDLSYRLLVVKDRVKERRQ